MAIFTTGPLSGRIVYADATYEMNDAGEERVGFTDEEWRIMMTDPSFGYVCRNGHTIDQTYAAHMGGCRTCDNLAEAY